MREEYISIPVPTSCFKVWDAVIKDWWIAPGETKKQVWPSARGAKSALTIKLHKKYKEISYRYKVIRCIAIMFREVK